VGRGSVRRGARNPLAGKIGGGPASCVGQKRCVDLQGANIEAFDLPRGKREQPRSLAHAGVLCTLWEVTSACAIPSEPTRMSPVSNETFHVAVGGDKIGG
jgi:acyl-coenzyme A thioesterase PaaI-like protein